LQPFTVQTLVSQIRQLASLYSKFETYKYHLQQNLEAIGGSSFTVTTATGYLRYDPTDLSERRVRAMVRSFQLPSNQVI
jgi:hypothetical protein